MWQYGERMGQWLTLRRTVTLVLLLLTATEIFTCDAAASSVCLFSSHSTKDFDDGCAGDGCLCCCAHIVIAQPIIPLAPLGSVTEATVAKDTGTPTVSPGQIEHPPRS
jgi:hypothetical protein